MVIIIHAGSALYHSCPLYEPAFVPLCFISTAARGSVPVFFMLTGLLMLSRERLELGHFFRRQFDTQIAASDHNRIGSLHDFVQMVQRSRFFQFRHQ